MRQRFYHRVLERWREPLCRFTGYESEQQAAPGNDPAVLHHPLNHFSPSCESNLREIMHHVSCMIVALTFDPAEPPKEPSLIAPPWSSLGNIAYEAIIEGILTGSLPAGTQISIDGSARQLKMSNTPVREALSRLAAERLVLFSANKGYTVTPRITAEEYHQLFGARRTLELASIKSAIIEPSAIGKIASILHQLSTTEGGAEYEQYRAFNQGDREFHLAFVCMSRNRFLRHAWEQLHFHLHVGRLYAGAGVIDLQEARTEHQSIFEALKEGNRKELLKRISDHISNAESRLGRLVSRA
ncbi:MAG: GntR family transcriptional regulator [Verrucomicrobia bacterium]|nr:GntR family transcriptional regulator [Verrucomicrobiota bacterium]